MTKAEVKPAVMSEATPRFGRDNAAIQAVLSARPRGNAGVYPASKNIAAKDTKKMKANWPSILPPFLRWRAIYWEQHFKIMWLKYRNPAPELAGVRIPVMSRLTDNICAAIYDGHYEGAELRTFKTMLDDKDVVLEVGAGIGFLSCYCARDRL